MARDAAVASDRREVDPLGVGEVANPSGTPDDFFSTSSIRGQRRATLEHRRGDDRLKAIPFIVISGVEQMDSIVACIKLGAEDYLPKPFDPVLLHAHLGACLDRKRMTDELLEWNTRLTERAEEKVGEVERLNRLRRFVTPQLAEAIAAGGDAILARATAASSRCWSATCAASPRSPRPPSPRR